MKKYKIKIIGLKELRENTATYISEVKKGKSFVVMRKSKPLFRIAPVENEDDESLWETVIDFTKFKKGGVPLKEFLAALQ